MKSRISKLSIPVVLMSMVAGGLLLATSSAATVQASRAVTTSTPVACPGTTDAGTVVVTCSGAGASDVVVVAHEGLYTHQPTEPPTWLTFQPTGLGSTGTGATISGVSVAETDSTTATGVVTLTLPGSTASAGTTEPVDVSITSTDGSVLNHVDGTQQTALKALLTVAETRGGNLRKSR